MKILMVDHSGLQLQTRKMLLEEEAIGSIDTATTLSEVYIAFKKGMYEMVIIDHMIENGQECVDHILNTDPMQPILVVSDAIHCIITRCEDCVNQHNIRRLSNPTPIRNIARMVKGFKGYACDHYDKETNRIHI